MPSQPKLVNLVCIYCGVEYITPIQNQQRGRKYCSDRCRLIAQAAEIITINCCYCSKLFERSIKDLRKSKGKFYFCSSACKYTAASDTKHPYITGPYGKKEDGASNYRQRALLAYPNECIRCGYNEYIELLDADHINSNRSDNCTENIQLLCVPCHWMKTRLPEVFYNTNHRIELYVKG